MSYVVFDLDETLVNIYSVYYFIASLKLKDHIKEHRSYLSIFFPDELFDEHESAYQRFVKYVLKEETSDKPIGVLRPGILEVMTKLNRLKRKGKVAHVIIYSNNGCLECLQFVRDLIHLHVGNPALITECIHRSHYLRSFEEYTLTKTWSVLRNILIHGACNAFQTISPKDVFFFDDLQHTDLQMNLAEQYYCVPSYQFRASFYRLSEIYANAINEAKVDTNMLLINVIDILEVGSRSDVTTMLNTNVYDIIFLFEKKVEHTAAPSDLPPLKDNGYRMMMDAIDEINHRHIKMSLISKKRHTCRKRRYTIRK